MLGYAPGVISHESARNTRRAKESPKGTQRIEGNAEELDLSEFESGTNGIVGHSFPADAPRVVLLVRGNPRGGPSWRLVDAMPQRGSGRRRHATLWLRLLCSSIGAGSYSSGTFENRDNFSSTDSPDIVLQHGNDPVGRTSREEAGRLLTER